jgi:primosomal protein N' (replication factor Y)
MSVLLEIAIPCPLRQSFHYLADESQPVWQKGERVLVSFRNRKLIGIVLSSEKFNQQSEHQLKKI